MVFIYILSDLFSFSKTLPAQTMIPTAQTSKNQHKHKLFPSCIQLCNLYRLYLQKLLGAWSAFHNNSSALLCRAIETEQVKVPPAGNSNRSSHQDKAPFHTNCVKLHMIKAIAFFPNELKRLVFHLEECGQNASWS